MLSIRNRHYTSEEGQPLPWGDPYILQLFEPILSPKASQSSQVPRPDYQAQHHRIRVEACPPLGDPRPDLDISRRMGDLAPQEDPPDNDQ